MKDAATLGAQEPKLRQMVWLQDNRTDAEKRVAEVEAEIKLIELEQQLAELNEERQRTHKARASRHVLSVLSKSNQMVLYVAFLHLKYASSNNRWTNNLYRYSLQVN